MANESEDLGERYLKKLRNFMGEEGHQRHMRAMNDLLARIKAKLAELETALEVMESFEEDGVYRFYHGSFKVFFIQDDVKDALKLIKEIGGASDPPNEWFCRIVKEGTAHPLNDQTNANWLQETRPILEAFWHTKYFLAMMVKYGKELESAPRQLPYGWAAVLYLFELR
jgi:hypothetical protein